ncbi:hypothetical protein H257_16135 [Aphanomyces astaci]|uniref:Uncharacterized protein n=1 Tax=Aphanomyces astaci TaxID=112090 RepID=W4FJW6_APHAT|nr:hypothetical protein H257_16135 [Aphanomyces astaci]ETV67780.1 hypothetical protein H257_16135 [Aphanomyces astaci]KAF0710721.1 hypothetical protein AaE_012409 [Aphanomyces astaci]RHY00783.1 hypothetical protein DYB25_009609 [Aphanomyces astaci]RHY07161.1 hypothetical protein DYB36_009452 [Aphanomyces astaci]RHY39903.1 hypothetical protein DYB30_007987 [Aphanomyces astaci]|eukprot:XP_009842773.1 hypothetical protein H257_16135 [Aphanomyces astaci]
MSAYLPCPIEYDLGLLPPPPATPPRKRPYRSSFAIVLDEAANKFRGQCKYKSGKCKNERTLKFNGEIHTLCEEHRLRHNRIQNKSDSKIRKAKRMQSMYDKLEPLPHDLSLPYDSKLMEILYQSGTDTCSSSGDSDDMSMADEYAWLPEVKLEEFGVVVDYWSPEDTFIFQNIMGLPTRKTV